MGISNGHQVQLRAATGGDRNFHLNGIRLAVLGGCLLFFPPGDFSREYLATLAHLYNSELPPIGGEDVALRRFMHEVHKMHNGGLP